MRRSKKIETYDRVRGSAPSKRVRSKRRKNCALLRERAAVDRANFRIADQPGVIALRLELETEREQFCAAPNQWRLSVGL